MTNHTNAKYKFFNSKRGNNLNQEMTFGVCLKFLLTTLNIRMIQLAKAINVDSSLVSRWVHEKRIPSSVYLDKISDFFVRLPITPIQLKLIEELTNDLDKSIPTTIKNNKEQIYWILEYSLNNSLNISNKKSETKKETLLNPSFNNAIDLSAQDKLIFGVESIYDTFISLLNLAIQDNTTTINDRKIYITHHNNLEISFFTGKKLNTLKQKLLEAVNNNWHVTCLLRLDCSTDSIIKFIQFSLPLIKTGRFQLFYLTNNESFMIRKEFYIVSGIGALSCLPSDSSFGIESAFFFSNFAAIDILINYANLLMEDSSTNMIKYYSPDMNESYFSSLAKANDQKSNLYSYNNSFNKLFIPPHLYTKFINQTTLSEKEKELSLYYYKKQFDGFMKTLQNYEFIDIYFLSSLDHLCEDKLFYLFTYAGIQIIPIENSDIIDYLEYIIYIISTYTNYHIALVSHDDDNFINNTTLLIKERQMVFGNTFEFDAHKLGVRLSISHPILVKAFVSYYHFIWKNIPSPNKDKHDIILLFNEYIKVLKNDLDRNLFI